MRNLPAFVLLLVSSSAFGHPWRADMPDQEREALREHILSEWKRDHFQTASTTSAVQLAGAAVANAAEAPAAAKAFLPFTRLDLRADGEFLHVGSNGLPDHGMMVGITAWQQQVPLPQNYFGDNAWRIPLKPVPAKEPAMIKGRFLRGAIALAVNGIPIFNPQNNRGEVSYEIGELDQWGGHCGRADDYHYHIVPLHLQAQAGKGMPVAYALDGYPIYGLTEPDGSPIGKLDECHGHEGAGVGYHYHASMKYPYVMGGFHGEVVEAGGQVDPQPRAQPVRPDTPPLRGATITAFEATGKDGYKLTYDLGGEKRSVSYTIKGDGSYPFVYDNGRDGVEEAVYTARGGGGRGGPPGQEPSGGPETRPGKGKGQGKGKGGREAGEMQPRGDGPPSAAPTRSAPQGMLDLNADGVVTAQEFADGAKADAGKRGMPVAEALSKARADFQRQDRDHNGQLDPGEWQAVAPVPAEAEPRGGKEPPMERQAPGGGRGGKQENFVERPDQPRSSDGKFLLSSPAVEDLKEMPLEYTGEGEAATLPLAWQGAPAGTRSYALIMDHADREGNMKWYWTLYDLPGNLASIPKNVKDVGKVGTGFKGQPGYEAPHSKGPGAKVYVVTLYALSEKLTVGGTPGREELLAAMKGKVLASSSLRVIHVSQGQGGEGSGKRPPPGPGKMNEAAPSSAGAPPPNPPASGGLRPLDNIFNPAPQSGAGGGKEKAKSKGKGGPPGLVKPSIADTMKLNVYADNWFMLYVNGRLVAVDSIQFTPHNVVSVDFLPEYPMTIAVLAKDNADPKTGMEYGTSIGDGGFILKFADGTVTNASWKGKNFFHGPIGGDAASPKVRQEALPANWWAVDFNDSAWAHATEYSVEQVDPKQPYFDNDFEGAKFIWTDDIALDNTVIFRAKMEKPGWTPRWNTKPDLDVTGVPNR